MKQVGGNEFTVPYETLKAAESEKRNVMVVIMSGKYTLRQLNDSYAALYNILQPWLRSCKRGTF